MKGIIYLPLLIAVTVMLSGCLYPQDRKAENQIPYEDQLQAVQLAVNKYKDASDGLLPIKNRDMETPIYLKYPIDFTKLTPRFLSDAPGNAFENGGIFQYILIDVEENPTVKVFDLRIAEKIRDIKMRLRSRDYPPFKDMIAQDVYSLDFTKLGYKTEPVVISPFTNNNLPFVITSKGEVYVDYISDLYLALKESEQVYKQGDDIRALLSDHSMLVPAYSLPYTIDENNEPIYMVK